MMTNCGGTAWHRPGGRRCRHAATVSKHDDDSNSTNDDFFDIIDIDLRIYSPSLPWNSGLLRAMGAMGASQPAQPASPAAELHPGG